MQHKGSSNETFNKAEVIRINGTVQGVGFRPFVWRLAQKFKLRGQVWNDAEGVVIQAWGSDNSLDDFRYYLQMDAPPLAHIECIRAIPLLDRNIPDDFLIIDSQQGNTWTNVSPDAASCPRCLAEIRDPANRRYRYPFTNCTHCGPRLSIIKAVPYDRANTSMHRFTMCPECQAEYDSPDNRRFHAQPNACKSCGPSLWLENAHAERIIDDRFVDVIAHTANLVQQGKIVALKGIGGFHLACDASNEQVVSQLRQRKQRYHKPFALMARDVDVIRRYACVSPQEEDLLQDSTAPIVLLSMCMDNTLPAEIAREQTRFGFMLPYTPLHSLLLQEIDFPVVMTSGNRSDEAQCTSNEQAREQLAGIADFILFHDRDIVNRLDDSVARVFDRKPQLLRRARGYAPHPIKLPQGFQHHQDVLAMGAELKNTFCLVKNGKAIVSQHQGDLEDASVFHTYRHSIDHYLQLFDHQPKLIAVDLHPEYISSKLGQQMAGSEHIELIKVQHHHAHIAACMVEHGLPLDSKPVLGIALDGLGYGDNGELWGGEFLFADYHGYQRLASFQAVPMPGGTRAIIEPWRNTFAHLHQSLGWQWVLQQYPNLAFVNYIQDKPVDNLMTMMKNCINSPLASSAGRLFDAVAALLGLCRDSVSYEGQAAMHLEALAEKTFASSQAYPFSLGSGAGEALLTIQWQPFWQAILSDVNKQVPADVIAGRFHQTIRQAIVDVVEQLHNQHKFSTVILSGGVLQNQLLLHSLLEELARQHFSVLVPYQLPANDGGIALGQAAVAIAQLSY